MRYNELGQEVPDDTPLEVPAGFRRPLTLTEQIQQAVRNAVSMSAVRNDFESFEEANDFEVEDDEFEDVLSEHEFRDMKSEIPVDAKAAFEEFRASRKPKPSLGAKGGTDGKVREGAPGEDEGGEKEGS